jgi:mevalonate pyrophosphate decarboxylase
MKAAITKRDAGEISRLAEIDTLNLHAVTMTGNAGMVLFSPSSIRIIDQVRRIRDEEDIPVWYSLDTGPSVFVNTLPDAASKVARRLEKALVDSTPVISRVGGSADLLDKHLF